MLGIKNTNKQNLTLKELQGEWTRLDATVLKAAKKRLEAPDYTLANLIENYDGSLEFSKQKV